MNDWYSTAGLRVCVPDDACSVAGRAAAVGTVAGVGVEVVAG